MRTDYVETGKLDIPGYAFDHNGRVKVTVHGKSAMSIWTFNVFLGDEPGGTKHGSIRLDIGAISPAQALEYATLWFNRSCITLGLDPGQTIPATGQMTDGSTEAGFKAILRRSAPSSTRQ